jgi:hypothetical protein
MKYLKMLALAAVAAAALMVFIGVGTASATTLCSTTVETCPAGQKLTVGTILDFTLTSGVSSAWKETSTGGGGGEVLDTCKGSTLKGEITNAGSSTETVTGKFTAITWGTCTFPTTTTLLGKFEIHKIAGTSNGTVTVEDGTENKMTINTIFFGTCVYAMPGGESIGDFTEGNPAVFHMAAVLEKTEGSNLACPETSVLFATYSLTSPATTVSTSFG